MGAHHLLVATGGSASGELKATFSRTKSAVGADDTSFLEFSIVWDIFGWGGQDSRGEDSENGCDELHFDRSLNF